MKDLREMISENKSAIIAVVLPTLIGAITTIYKAMSKSDNKDNRIYDPRLGFYWELRRRITNNERRAIERKKRNGEALGDILEEMKLLK